MTEKRAKKSQLGVYMNNVSVGTLTKFPNGGLEFRYTPDWLNRELSLPISRSMPLREQPYIGELVINFFDNLLPDNQNIRQMVARKAQSDSTDAFDILAKIGRDCVGALQLLPDDFVPDSGYESGALPVSDEEIERRLKNLRQNPLGIGDDEDFRISIAGAQEKTAFLKKDGKWHIPIGTMPTTHIFKTAMGLIKETIDMRNSVENEWLCLRICKAFGLEVADAEILNFGEVRALVVSRFDRSLVENKLYRKPQEDMCQALGVPSNKKYEADGGPGILQIMDVLNESSHRERDRHEFMKAQVVFWVLDAIDGHAKNFSLFLTPGGLRLTPLYDIMSAFPVTNAASLREKKIKMAMAVGDGRYWKPGDIQRRHWLQTAKKARFLLEEMDSILDEVLAMIPTVIEKVTKELPTGFKREVFEPVFLGMTQRSRALANAAIPNQPE